MPERLTDCPRKPSHGCVWTREAMHVQTKFLRLRNPVALGDRIDDWRVCWLGGWDKCRVFFVVMVEREDEQPVVPCASMAKERNNMVRPHVHISRKRSRREPGHTTLNATARHGPDQERKTACPDYR